MSKYIRLSHTLDMESPSYGNGDKMIIRINSSIKNGDTANTSCWIFSNNHIGTHIDVPRHFDDNGLKVIDIPLENFFFHTVALVDIPCNSSKLITGNDFEALTVNPHIDLLLIRTGYENIRTQEAYWNNNPGLSPELAEYFRSRFTYMRCVGFDFISITSWKYRQEGRLAHKAFLCPNNGEKTILLIEDMALKEITQTIDKVIVAPIYVEDGNGGAVTIFAEIKE
jgi:kynurenine formamidase